MGKMACGVCLVAGQLFDFEGHWRPWSLKMMVTIYNHFQFFLGFPDLLAVLLWALQRGWPWSTDPLTFESLDFYPEKISEIWRFGCRCWVQGMPWTFGKTWWNRGLGESAGLLEWWSKSGGSCSFRVVYFLDLCDKAKVFRRFFSFFGEEIKRLGIASVIPNFILNCNISIEILLSEPGLVGLCRAGCEHTAWPWSSAWGCLWSVKKIASGVKIEKHWCIKCFFLEQTVAVVQTLVTTVFLMISKFCFWMRSRDESGMRVNSSSMKAKMTIRLQLKKTASSDFFGAANHAARRSGILRIWLLVKGF